MNISHSLAYHSKYLNVNVGMSVTVSCWSACLLSLLGIPLQTCYIIIVKYEVIICIVNNVIHLVDSKGLKMVYDTSSY
jgi:hypothetical protein